MIEVGTNLTKRAWMCALVALFFPTSVFAEVPTFVDCPEGTIPATRDQRDWGEHWCEKEFQGVSRREGPTVIWLNGKQGSWIHGQYRYGKRDGTWQSWHSNGQLAGETEYSSGKIRGETTSWHPNGQLKRRGQSERGRRIGTWVWWYENGQREREEQYEEGVPNGPWRSWYPDGQLEQEGVYLDGKASGHWTIWYENGMVEREGEASAGVRTGAWTFHDREGNIVAQGEYRGGSFAATGQAPRSSLAWDPTAERSVPKFRLEEVLDPMSQYRVKSSP